MEPTQEKGEKDDETKMKLYIVIWWSGWDIVKVVHITPIKKDAQTFMENFHDGPENCSLHVYEEKNLMGYLLGWIKNKIRGSQHKQ